MASEILKIKALASSGRETPSRLTSASLTAIMMRSPARIFVTWSASTACSEPGEMAASSAIAMMRLAMPAARSAAG